MKSWNRCECEHFSHFDDTEFSSVQTGHDYVTMQEGHNLCAYVGSVCDFCVSDHMQDYLTPNVVVTEVI